MTLGVAAGVAVVPVGVAAMSAFCSKRFWDTTQKHIKIQRTEKQQKDKKKKQTKQEQRINFVAQNKCMELALMTKKERFVMSNVMSEMTHSIKKKKKNILW